MINTGPYTDGDPTIEEFCEKHKMLQADYEQHIGTQFQSLKEFWQKAKAEDIVWFATHFRVLTDDELRLFAIFCCSCVQYLLPSSNSHKFLDVAKRYATRSRTEHSAETYFAIVELQQAERDAAAEMKALSFHPFTPVMDMVATAIWSTCWVPQADVKNLDLYSTHYAVSLTTSAYVASYPERKSNYADFVTMQAEWLRYNTTPNFKRPVAQG